MTDRSRRLARQPDLIIDVGANNGDDTAHYLSRGFSVIAIEANPALADEIVARFPEQVASGALTVLNVGIARQRGRLPFWVSEESSVLSSFDRDLVERDGRLSHAIDVDCVPFDEVLSRFGIPYYLKVDIEGYDRVCLDALDAAACPEYVSCELTHVCGSIEQLHSLQYRRFKLVNQSTYTEATPVFDSELGFRALRKLCHFVPTLKQAIPDGVRSDFDTFIDGRRDTFPPGSSGPFGEETHGPWRSAEETLRRYAAIRARFERAGIPLEQCWYDVHARHS